ncbi:MAG TPA: hypothetical protein VHP32_12220 [Ignavibacteria bacterium]|nr:hypothetical protein [Ignavibacteria bacterium]
MGLQAANFAFYFVLFKINQQKLIDEVCEKVVENCNACCYLDKKITEQNGDSNTQKSNVNKFELKILDYTIANFLQQDISSSNLISYHSFSDGIFNQYYSFPEPPPKA